MVLRLWEVTLCAAWPINTIVCCKACLMLRKSISDALQFFVELTSIHVLESCTGWIWWAYWWWRWRATWWTAWTSFFLSVLFSMDLPLACFSGEESRFAFLANFVVQILALEGGVCISGNLPLPGENLSLLPSGCLHRFA